MISQLDETLRPFNLGISTPIRYKLFLNLVKLKMLQPLEGKRIQLRIKAMNDSQIV